MPTSSRACSRAASPTACQPPKRRAGGRPASALTAALTDASGTPAWQAIPSWAVVGTEDQDIPPAEQMFMATRAHAHITEVAAPHLSMISNPGVVTQVIVDAARAAG